MKLVKAGSLLPLLLSGRALVAPRPLTRAPSCRTIGRASPPRMAVIDPSFNLALGSLALGSAFGAVRKSKTGRNRRRGTCPAWPHRFGVKGSPVKFAPAALLLAAFGAFVRRGVTFNSVDPRRHLARARGGAPRSSSDDPAPRNIRAAPRGGAATRLDDSIRGTMRLLAAASRDPFANRSPSRRLRSASSSRTREPLSSPKPARRRTKTS